MLFALPLRTAHQTKPKQTKKMYERMFDSSFEYEILSKRSNSTSHCARMNFSHVIIYNCKYFGHFKSFSKHDNDGDDGDDGRDEFAVSDENIYKRISCMRICIE